MAGHRRLPTQAARLHQYPRVGGHRIGLVQRDKSTVIICACTCARSLQPFMGDKFVVTEALLFNKVYLPLEVPLVFLQTWPGGT